MDETTVSQSPPSPGNQLSCMGRPTLIVFGVRGVARTDGGGGGGGVPKVANVSDGGPTVGYITFPCYHMLLPRGGGSANQKNPKYTNRSTGCNKIRFRIYRYWPPLSLL